MIAVDRPWAFAALAVAVPLVWWWHRRRGRPRTVVVSGLAHWRAVAHATPNRRRAASLELAVAIATVVALVVGAAGPVVVGNREAAQWTVVVDRSASVGATRVDAPYAAAIEQLDAWAASDAVAPAFDVVAIPPLDGDATLAAVARARPARVASDPAFDRTVRAAVAAGGTVVAIADRPPPRDLAGVGWIRLATPAGRNAAIAWVRPDARPPTVGVYNDGDTSIARPLELVRDGRVTSVASCAVAPGQTATVALPDSVVLAAGDRLRLAGEDANALDDSVTVRGAGLAIADVHADAPVPAALVAALDAAAGLTVVRRDAGDVGEPGHVGVYWRVSVADPARVALAFGAEGRRFGALAFGAPVAIDRVRSAPVEHGAVSPIPTRVVRAHRITGPLDGWRVLATGLDATGGEHPLLLARSGHLVVAFDPIADAPGWVRTPGFPALVFDHVERARGVRVEGVLAASESRIVVGAASARPPDAASAPAPARRGDRSLAEEALAIALLGLVVLACLGAGVTRRVGRAPAA